MENLGKSPMNSRVEMLIQKKKAQWIVTRCPSRYLYAPPCIIHRCGLPFCERIPCARSRGFPYFHLEGNDRNHDRGQDPNHTKLAPSGVYTATPLPSSMSTKSNVDVLIIGAGPAGLMCANGLARAGVTVRIIDQRWVAPSSVPASHLLKYPNHSTPDRLRFRLDKRMEYSRGRLKCSRSAANPFERNDDLWGLTFPISRAMDSQNVCCVKETRCTWPLVFVHTHPVPRWCSRVTDGCSVRVHTTGVLQSGSELWDRTYRESTRRHGAYRQISFRGQYCYYHSSYIMPGYRGLPNRH
jgi:hypothetical protein